VATEGAAARAAGRNPLAGLSGADDGESEEASAAFLDGAAAAAACLEDGRAQADAAMAALLQEVEG
jgi:hypothetical protein